MSKLTAGNEQTDIGNIHPCIHSSYIESLDIIVWRTTMTTKVPLNYITYITGYSINIGVTSQPSSCGGNRDEYFSYPFLSCMDCMNQCKSPTESFVRLKICCTYMSKPLRRFYNITDLFGVHFLDLESVFLIENKHKNSQRFKIFSFVNEALVPCQVIIFGFLVLFSTLTTFK